MVTLAMIVRNSWVDASGDVAAAARVDRRSIIVLASLYFVGAAALFIESLA